MSKRLTNGSAGVQASTGVGHPGQDAGPLEVLVGQGHALEEADDEDAVVGQVVDDGRAHPGGGGPDAVLVLGPAVDGQLVGRTTASSGAPRRRPRRW